MIIGTSDGKYFGVFWTEIDNFENTRLQEYNYAYVKHLSEKTQDYVTFRELNSEEKESLKNFPMKPIMW